ncbi:UPF0758 protein yicR [Bacteroides coprosuis DSM 18011]|uniref:UPF0758 protein yicR n=1 Tax=Bacteroides coprosuis DSM 18011 TaxID=679937 RepID=F3ZRZ4_9BACE|nr:DNA repair protein RadC [Bacteroides coprosuis]EGJ70800.1 UPF0758 protein yicR [Bacteroides coprosuis DSM 18011]
MTSPIKLTMHQWAEEDRPREKLINQGAEQLTTVELIALLLGSGNKDESAVELARKMVLHCNEDLSQMAKWSSSEFMAFNGIGAAKYATLKAALELGNRRQSQEATQRKTYRCSTDIYQLFHPILCDAVQEEFWILLLNQACRIIKHTQISRGGIDGTYADVRSILREALVHRATQLVLIHNHPSGNTQPSISDKQLTQKIKEASLVMNILLIDHLIITDGNYYSFADKGIL